MSFNFTEALDTHVTDVEKPPVAPRGNYIFEVMKVPTQTQSKTGEWDILEFAVRALEADDSIDPDELQAFGDIRGNISRVSFMFPTDPSKEVDAKKTLHRLRKFLETTLRVDTDDNPTLNEMIANSVHCQFWAELIWKPSDDGEETYTEIKNYAPVD